MFLEMDHWDSGYAQILQDCRGHGSNNSNNNSDSTADDAAVGTVLLLCNADADALAAARILSYLLRNDGVPYTVRPCRSPAQLRRACRTHAAASNANGADGAVRAVVLLNLGAHRNLARMLFEGAPEEDGGEGSSGSGNNGAPPPLLPLGTRVYVMDCRRPVHLANLYDERNIVVFWDSHHPAPNGNGDGDLPSDGDNLSGDESSSSSSSSDDDDDDDDSSDEDDGDDQENEFEMDGGGDDEGDEFGRGAKRQQGSALRPDESTMLDDAGQEQDADYDGEDEKDPDGRDRDRSAAPPSPTKKSSRSDRSALDETAITEATTPDDPDADASDDEDDAGDADDGGEPLPALTPRELHRDRRRRLHDYYASGSYHGAPAAFVAHAIATRLRFHQVGDLLWLACVGVTDAYLHARLDLSGYSQLVVRLREACHGLFPNDEFSRVGSAVYAETLLGGNGSASGSNDHLTRIAFSGNGRILAETDFRFFLLRHTSLYDAMLHSDYVSTRLQLPTAKGMHKLQEMLAKMGFPLEECKQPFAFMKPSLRRQLKDRLQEQKEEYGLENFEFTSFFRITGYQSLLSASDTSYAVTALLECDDAPNEGTSLDDDDDDDERLLQSFNRAFDALNSNQAPAVSLTALGGSEEGSGSLANLVNGGPLASGGGGLGAGLRLAMQLQKSIMRTAAGLMDRNAVTRLSHFRYAYVTCTSQGEHGTSGGADDGNRAVVNDDETADHVFSKPLALTRLAHYLMDWNRENGKWAGRWARPLVLLAEKPRAGTFLIAGYEYPESAGDLVWNKFGRHFETVAASITGTFVLDSFDSNVVEVARPDAQRFLEQLHYLMDAHSRI